MINIKSIINIVRMQCIIALLVCLFVVAYGHRVNYCGARMCRNLDSHTFCQYSPGPGGECTGHIEGKLTNDEKYRLLARLNRRRNDAALGRLRGLPSAGDMMKLRWIEELAKEAQLWADQCRPPSTPEKRDECRDLYSISVGQCIASVVGEAPGLRVESMVDMWYMQGLLYKGNVTSYTPSDNDRYFYGDFGQMLWAKSYMVGCGRSRFMIPSQGRLRSVERLVCNLSPAGPEPYRTLWSPAAPSTACPPRSLPDKTHGALCNYQFKMDASDDVNNTMNIEEHVLLNSVLEIEKNESLAVSSSLDELYLTNLAIVTMDTVESSTSLYNSLHKRNVVEAFGIENYNTKDNNNKQKKMINNLRKLTLKASKNKISTIGRPKTYNMEDLTEIGDDHKENNHETVEEIPKSFNDVYGDYNIDMQEENETITEATKRKHFNKESIAYNTSTITQVANIIYNDTTNKSVDEIESTSKLQLYDTSGNITELSKINFNDPLISNEQTGEDYLSDSETVRQLQQTLDRMEQDKQTAKVLSKVRRDITDMPSQISENNSSYMLSPEEYLNKTVDRVNVLNMVMKYFPYLKSYEGGLLGNINSVKRVHPSLCLALVLFLCVMFCV